MESWVVAVGLVLGLARAAAPGPANAEAPFLWLGIGSWLPRVLPVGAGLGEAAGFLGLFALGWLAWAVAVAGVAGRGGAGAGTGIVRAVDVAAGIGLGGLGVLVVTWTLAGA